MQRGLLAALAIVTLVVVGLRAWLAPSASPSGEGAPPTHISGTPAPRPAMLSAVPIAAMPSSAASPAPAAVASMPPQPPRPVTAAQSLAEARLHGDDRVPPISAPSPEADATRPTPWDTSDPSRFADYERRQQRRLEAAYVQAADRQLPVWRAALDEARARGASAEDLARGEEKIRKLEAMRDRAQAAGAAASR